MARIALMTMLVGVMGILAGCTGSGGPAARSPLADEILREGQGIALLLWKRLGAGSSDDLLSAVGENRSSFDEAVDLPPRSKTTRGS